MVTYKITYTQKEIEDILIQDIRSHERIKPNVINCSVVKSNVKTFSDGFNIEVGLE